MDVYKDFIQRLRKFEFEVPYLLLSEDLTEQFKEYVKLLHYVKFDDGRYHAYYGEAKKIVNSFLTFYSAAIDDVIKEADFYLNDVEKEDLVWLWDRTFSAHKANQEAFKNEFLPITSELEQEVYDEIIKGYDVFMEKINDMKERINRLDKPSKVVDFANEQFALSVQRCSQEFDFVHVYIGLMLVDAVYKMRISLQEILLRMTKNKEKIQEECDEGINQLLMNLFDKNKEFLAINRRTNKRSVELAEVNYGIQLLKNRIERVHSQDITRRVEREVVYWSKRLEDFMNIIANLNKLKEKQEVVKYSERMYSSVKCLELPGCRFVCWKSIGDSLEERKEYLNDLFIKETKALVTFFAVRGTDRIIYTNNIGPYYVDEFNHQVYVFDFGLGVYHVNCDGDFVEFTEEPYYYDREGHYIVKNGEKLYQAATCTSQYNLRDDDLLTKVTKDCGHSEKINKKCKMEITDPTNVEILPDFDPIDITQTLDTETVRYLWDCFGFLLPEALYDVGTARPKNPIHFLAHKILYHKYRRTASEISQKKKEADQYQADIFKNRKEKAVAAAKKWASKQMKRAKPELSDEAPEKIAGAAVLAEEMFLFSSMNYHHQ